MIMKQHSKKTTEKPVEGKQEDDKYNSASSRKKNEALNKNTSNIGTGHTKDEKSTTLKKKNS